MAGPEVSPQERASVCGRTQIGIRLSLGNTCTSHSLHAAPARGGPVNDCLFRKIPLFRTGKFAPAQCLNENPMPLDETLLVDLPPFRRLDAKQIREILDLARPHRYDRGEPVFDQGVEASAFFLLLDGHIRVERLSPAGDRVVPLHIPPGQLFGIAVALGRDTYPATAVAASDCVVLAWPNSLWGPFVSRYEGFATETYKVVGARVEEMNNRIMELATQQVQQRVACALLRMSRQNGRTVEDGVEIDFPLTRRNISEMTGSTLHTVSRLLSAWELDGVLKSQRKRISVLDSLRLEQLANP